jgi:pantetheine-phosphate adenylyltransferase
MRKQGGHIMRKAIYPGSFDPFTNGHLDIVKKSAALFDEVYVVIGVNSQKRRTFEADAMRKAIEQVMESLHISNVRVEVYEGLVAEFAKQQGIKYMIRGLRNNMDSIGNVQSFRKFVNASFVRLPKNY